MKNLEPGKKIVSVYGFEGKLIEDNGAILVEIEGCNDKKPIEDVGEFMLLD